MKALKRITLATFAGLILVGPCSGVWAEEPKSSQPEGGEATVKAPSAPVYKPPLRGAPGGRVGGGAGRILLAAWTAPIFIMMTLVATKLPHYVLFMWPALAVVSLA